MENIDLSGGQQKNRKTITIENIKEMTNEIMANKRVSQEEKRGITILTEAILFGSKNYKGFGYLEQPYTKATEYNRYYI